MTADYSFLRHHALTHVRCGTDQDQQFRLQPQRLTPSAGVMRSFRVMWDMIKLPDNFGRWHVYTVGGIDPIAFNLLHRSFEWISFADACNDRNMIANIYNVDGVELPRHDTYYRYTQTGALIVTVRINNRIPVNFASDKIYVRVYTNAFWNRTESASIARKVQVHGVIAESALIRDTFISQYNGLLAESPAPGVLSFYHNGIKKEALNAGLINIGDSLEYVWDGSVKAQYKIKIKDLATFDSTLDNKSKFLFHYVGVGPTTIDFYDDVDFHISGLGVNPSYLYFHHNAEDAIRQVTHRDYALAVTYVQRHASKLVAMGPVTGTENMYITATIRHAGFDRPIVWEHGRLHELYKMADEQVQRAMTGIDATVDVWRAAILEASGYTEVMRAPVCDVTPDLVEKAYGYFAMAKYLADSPVVPKDIGGNPYCEVPFKLMHGCTAYEYDADGLFLGWHHHYVGDRYYLNNDNARLVEFIAGIGGSTLDEVHGVTTATIKNDRNYKVYLRTKVAGVLQANPRDVTGTNLYSIVNGVFTWLSPSTTAYPTLRSDKTFYAVDHAVRPLDGLMVINMQTQQNHNGQTGWGRLVIPLGQLDVILNGRSLIYGLDYFYKNGAVYITAKEWLVNPETDLQQVHIRFAGFCRSDMTIYPEGDVGYIEHGLLSNNKRFDLRDGKVQRIIARGKLVNKADVEFSEESNQIAITHASNGSPYMIKDMHVPLRPEIAKDTYELLAIAQTIDKSVSDYITPRLPETNRGPLTAIPDRYQVFSPFLCKLIFDIRFARLTLPVKPSFSLQDVVEICKPYEYLLEVDPIRQQSIVNPAYVVVLPHSLPTVVNLTHHQYQFMYQVVAHYANGLVSLSPSVSLSA